MATNTEVISVLVDLIQASAVNAANSGVVSAIIAKQVAEGRTTWTDEELASVQALVDEAQAAAVAAADKLP